MANRAKPVKETPRRKRRKELRPSEIVEAGLQVFVEKGYAATRLEDIAKRAGVVKGTIYRYFDSKEALFREAIQLRIEPIVGQTDQIIENYTGPSDQLLRMVIGHLYARLVRSEARELVRVIIAEARRFPEIPEFYHQVILSKAMDLVRKIIERGIAQGDFAPIRAAKYPMAIIAPAFVALIWQLTFSNQQPLDLEEYQEAHIELILRALKASP